MTKVVLIAVLFRLRTSVRGQVFEGQSVRGKSVREVFEVKVFEGQYVRGTMCSRDKVFEEISVRGTKCSRYQLTRLIITMFIPQIEPSNTRVSNI